MGEINRAAKQSSDPVSTVVVVLMLVVAFAGGVAVWTVLDPGWPSVVVGAALAFVSFPFIDARQIGFLSRRAPEREAPRAKEVSQP